DGHTAGPGVSRAGDELRQVRRTGRRRWRREPEDRRQRRDGEVALARTGRQEAEEGPQGRLRVEAHRNEHLRAARWIVAAALRRRGARGRADAAEERPRR